MTPLAPWGASHHHGADHHGSGAGTVLEPVLLRQRYRVKMADVDASGVIYYAAPLRWQEAMSTEWMASIGHPLGAMLAVGQGCPCVEAAARYLAPLRFDDVVELRQVCEHVGTTSFRTRMDVVFDDGRVAAQARSHLVWTTTGPAGVPEAVHLPSWLRAALTNPPGGAGPG